MYRRTIWQDQVAGVQDGTDMNAANFNNLEAGTMEAAALAAFNAACRRYEMDEAANAKVIKISQTLTGATAQSVVIPAAATRNKTDYFVDVEISSVTGGTCGDVVISTKQANGFMAQYKGNATSVSFIFKVSGGII